MDWGTWWATVHGVAKSRMQLSDFTHSLWGFPSGSVVESSCRCRRHGFSPWVRKSPWRRKWQPIPAFMFGKSQGLRILAGYSPWGCKKSDMSGWLSTHLILSRIISPSQFPELVPEKSLLPDEVRWGDKYGLPSLGDRNLWWWSIHLSTWHKWQITNIAENMQKLEYLCIAWRNVKWCRNGKRVWQLLKNLNIYTQ